MKTTTYFVLASLASAGAVTTDFFSQKQTGLAVLLNAKDSQYPQGHCNLGPPTIAGVPKELKGIKAATGVSTELYKTGMCGMCIQVTEDKDTSYTLYVNDECLSCGTYELNVYSDVDAEVRKDVTWQPVACDVGTTSIMYNVMGGVDGAATYIQPRFNKYPLAKVEAQVDGDMVEGVLSPDYNAYMFTAPLAVPIKVRLTSIFNEQVSDVITKVGDAPTAGSKKVQFKTGAAAADDSKGGDDATAADDSKGGDDATAADDSKGGDDATAADDSKGGDKKKGTTGKKPTKKDANTSDKSKKAAATDDDSKKLRGN